MNTATHTPDRRGTIPDWALLLIVYLGSVALRTLLSYYFLPYMCILIDENLYFNLAQSIWSEGIVAYHGQPMNYDSLLYPLVISPFFALPASVNIQRVLQLFNAFLINAAIFPAWMLSRKVTKDRKSSWVVVLFTLLMPDMAMNSAIMTESLGFPLLLLAAYFAYCTFSEGKLSHTLLTVLFCLLLYFTKPGTVAFLAAFCCILLYQTLKTRSKKGIASLLIAIACTAAFFLLKKPLLEAVFKVDYAHSSIYDRQTPALTISNLVKSLGALPRYIGFFALSCLAFPLLLPLTKLSAYESPERKLTLFTCFAVLFAILGTGFIVYLGEVTSTPPDFRIHLRYIAHYLPIFLMLCLSPKVRDTRISFAIIPMSVSMIALTILSYDFSSLLRSGIDAPALSPFSIARVGSHVAPFYRYFLYAAAAIILLISVLACTKKWTRLVRILSFGALALWFILSNGIFYLTVGDFTAGYADEENARMLSSTAADAAEVMQIIGDEDFILVVSDSPNGERPLPPLHLLNLRTRAQHMAVKLQDLAANTNADGSFSPFIPSGYGLVNPIHATGKIQWIVADGYTQRYLMPANPQEAISSPNGHYLLIPIREGEPWVSHLLTGITDNNVLLAENDSCTLYLFDTSRRESVHLWLVVETAFEYASAQIKSGSFIEDIPMEASEKWYEATIPVQTDAGQPMVVEITPDSLMMFEGYHID